VLYAQTVRVDKLEEDLDFASKQHAKSVEELHDFMVSAEEEPVMLERQFCDLAEAEVSCTSAMVDTLSRLKMCEVKERDAQHWAIAEQAVAEEATAECDRRALQVASASGMQRRLADEVGTAELALKTAQAELQTESAQVDKLKSELKLHLDAESMEASHLRSKTPSISTIHKKNQSTQDDHPGSNEGSDQVRSPAKGSGVAQVLEAAKNRAHSRSRNARINPPRSPTQSTLALPGIHPVDVTAYHAPQNEAEALQNSMGHPEAKALREVVHVLHLEAEAQVSASKKWQAEVSSAQTEVSTAQKEVAELQESKRVSQDAAKKSQDAARKWQEEVSTARKEIAELQESKRKEIAELQESKRISQVQNSTLPRPGSPEAKPAPPTHAAEHPQSSHSKALPVGHRPPPLPQVTSTASTTDSSKTLPASIRNALEAAGTRAQARSNTDALELQAMSRKVLTLEEKERLAVEKLRAVESREAALIEALRVQFDAHKVELREANQRADEQGAGRLNISESDDARRADEAARYLEEAQAETAELRQRLAEQKTLLASAVESVERVGVQISAEKQERSARARPTRNGKRNDGARRGSSRSRQVKIQPAWQPFGNIRTEEDAGTGSPKMRSVESIYRDGARTAGNLEARERSASRARSPKPVVRIASPPRAAVPARGASLRLSTRSRSPSPNDGRNDYVDWATQPTGQLGQLLGEVAALDHEMHSRSQEDVNPPNVGRRSSMGPSRVAWA
jgi:hypothetical protein